MRELFNFDLMIPEEMLLKDIDFPQEMIHHKMRSLRSENYYIYKIITIQDYETVMHGCTKYRFICAKMGKPIVEI